MEGKSSCIVYTVFKDVFAKYVCDLGMFAELNDEKLCALWKISMQAFIVKQRFWNSDKL